MLVEDEAVVADVLQRALERLGNSCTIAPSAEAASRALRQEPVDGVTLDHPRLVLPHPRMWRRAFVLAPLADLDPRLEVPGHGPVAALLERCRNQSIERIA